MHSVAMILIELFGLIRSANLYTISPQVVDRGAINLCAFYAGR